MKDETEVIDIAEMACRWFAEIATLHGFPAVMIGIAPGGHGIIQHVPGTTKLWAIDIMKAAICQLESELEK